jgi:hypothetical protein
LGIWTLDGAAMADGGAIELDGDTGTELTWMTSSWKSPGGLVLFALSKLSNDGSGVGSFACRDGL